MKNYLVLNGKSSDFVRGLMILYLPPISKPPIRASIEEIDGVDGDRVTKLGYAAYDKTVVIGLRGDYDENEVVGYFDSEGTVVFSNEPFLYYRYQILEQIDLQKLIRFRTAQVVFHVQPFKYQMRNNRIEVNFTEEESEEESEETEAVENSKSVTIYNSGNTASKPKLTVYGSGDISVSVNGELVLNIGLGDEEYIEIDSETLDAKKDGILKNRLCVGDYENLALKTGKNVLAFDGDVTKVVVENATRFI